MGDFTDMLVTPIFLGRDLVLQLISDSLAIKRKVLTKDNGQVVYRSTVCSLTLDELVDETMKRKRVKHTEKVNEILKDGFKYEDFANNPTCLEMIMIHQST